MTEKTKNKKPQGKRASRKPPDTRVMDMVAFAEEVRSLRALYNLDGKLAGEVDAFLVRTKQVVQQELDATYPQPSSSTAGQR